MGWSERFARSSDHSEACPRRKRNLSGIFGGAIMGPSRQAGVLFDEVREGAATRVTGGSAELLVDAQ